MICHASFSFYMLYDYLLPSIHAEIPSSALFSFTFRDGIRADV